MVSSAIFVSRLTGLAREAVMAYFFGAGLAYDAFLLGFRIPSLSRNLFAEGALSPAFVPVFTATLLKQGRDDALQLMNIICTAILIVVGALCIVGVVFAPQLVWMLAPGYAAVPGKFELAVKLTRIMFPFLLLVALAALAMAALNSFHKFGVPAIASAFFNIGSICIGLPVGFWIGPHVGITPIQGMGFGVLVGGVLQLACQIPSLRKLGITFRPTLDWSDPRFRHILRLMVPAIITGAALQINIVVNTNFASRISDPLRGPDGPVSWLAYAYRFLQFPLGLFGASFAAAMLPSVSESAAVSNFEEFRKTLSRSLAMVFLFTVPSSLGLIVLSRPIVGAIFQSGHFDAYDTTQTAAALVCYGIGLTGFAASKILNPAFYALGDARTPMYFSLLSIGANVCLVLLLLARFHLGHASLALSPSIVAILSSLALIGCVRRKLGGIEARYLADRIIRIAAASTLMIIPVVFIDLAMHSDSPTRWTCLAQLAISLPTGVLAFAIGCRVFHIQEVMRGWRAIAVMVRRSTFVSRVKIQS